MKKYKVTSKHPVFKENLIIVKSPDEENEFNLLVDEERPYEVWETISKMMLKGHISEGWIEEIQKPLFTTEDGKDMYINDMVWLTENNHAFITKVKQPEKGYYDILNTLEKCKAFSTEEAAKKYIDQNKLKFSEVDMIEFAEWCYSIYPNRLVNNKINHVDIFQWQLKIN